VFYSFLQVRRSLSRSVVLLIEAIIRGDEQACLLVRRRVLRQSVARPQDLSRANKIKVTKGLKTLIKETCVC